MVNFLSIGALLAGLQQVVVPQQSAVSLEQVVRQEVVAPAEAVATDFVMPATSYDPLVSNIKTLTSDFVADAYADFRADYFTAMAAGEDVNYLTMLRERRNEVRQTLRHMRTSATDKDKTTIDNYLRSLPLQFRDRSMSLAQEARLAEQEAGSSFSSHDENWFASYKEPKQPTASSWYSGITGKLGGWLTGLFGIGLLGMVGRSDDDDDDEDNVELSGKGRTIGGADDRAAFTHVHSAGADEGLEDMVSFMNQGADDFAHMGPRASRRTKVVTFETAPISSQVYSYVTHTAVAMLDAGTSPAEVTRAITALVTSPPFYLPFDAEDPAAEKVFARIRSNVPLYLERGVLGSMRSALDRVVSSAVLDGYSTSDLVREYCSRLPTIGSRVDQDALALARADLERGSSGNEASQSVPVQQRPKRRGVLGYALAGAAVVTLGIVGLVGYFSPQQTVTEVAPATEITQECVDDEYQQPFDRFAQSENPYTVPEQTVRFSPRSAPGYNSKNPAAWYQFEKAVQDGNTFTYSLGGDLAGHKLEIKLSDGSRMYRTAHTAGTIDLPSGVLVDSVGVYEKTATGAVFYSGVSRDDGTISLKREKPERMSRTVRV